MERLSVFLGASGRVGSALRAHADNEAAARMVWQYRSPVSVGLGHSGRKLLWRDFSEDAPLRHFHERHGPIGCLIGFAGDRFAHDPRENTRRALAVLRVAHALKIPRVLLASTAAVYGGSRFEPYHEHETPVPHTAYGRSKRHMEVATQMAADAYGMELCIMRIGNVLGADQLTFGETPRALSIYPDGRAARRSYISPPELLRVLTRLSSTEAPPPRIVNVAGPSPQFMDEVLDDSGVQYERVPSADGSNQYMTLDTRFLQQVLERAEIAAPKHHACDDLRQIA